MYFSFGVLRISPLCYSVINLDWNQSAFKEIPYYSFCVIFRVYTQAHVGTSIPLFLFLLIMGLKKKSTLPLFQGSQLQVALLAWAGSHTKCPPSLSHPVLLGLCILFQICHMVGVLDRLHFSLPTAFPLFSLPAAEQGKVHMQLWEAHSWQEEGAPIS